MMRPLFFQKATLHKFYFQIVTWAEQLSLLPIDAIRTSDWAAKIRQTELLNNLTNAGMKKLGVHILLKQISRDMADVQLRRLPKVVLRTE